MVVIAALEMTRCRRGALEVKKVMAGFGWLANLSFAPPLIVEILRLSLSDSLRMAGSVLAVGCDVSMITVGIGCAIRHRA